jgi:hypothetical protein
LSLCFLTRQAARRTRQMYDRFVRDVQYGDLYGSL